MARKILLADDSVTAQNMGRKILADAGYEVIAVNNGSAALKKIAELKPDLVILDVYMPGYSGLEVCQRLKESQETARIPVLLTVGKLEPFKPEEAQRVRAEGYIVKPFEASELLSALSKLEDKVVPRSEPSKPGRFARAIAAAEESGRGGEISGNDNGWKSRINFPHSKPEEKAADDSSTGNPVNRDVSTVEKTSTEKAEPAQKHYRRKEDRKPAAESTAEASVDVAALASPGLPTDVTPEEVAAIAAAAAQIQIAGEALKDEPRAAEQPSRQEPISESQISEAAISAPVISAPVISESAISEPASSEPTVKTEISEPQAQRNELDAVVSQFVAADEPVTMAATAESVIHANLGGARWTAVSVALDSDEASISLDEEMRIAVGQHEPGSVIAPEAVAPDATVSIQPEAVADVNPQISSVQEPQALPEAAPAPANAASDFAASDPPNQGLETSNLASANLPGDAANNEVVNNQPDGLPEPVSTTTHRAETEAVPSVQADTAPVASTEAYPASAFAQQNSEPNASAEPAPAAETMSAVAPSTAEAQPASAPEAASEPVPLNSYTTFAPVAHEVVQEMESPNEPHIDNETVKTTAAAWASWRQIRDTGKPSNAPQSQAEEANPSQPAPAETSAMAVAAGAERIMQEAAASSPNGHPADVASIVDSVLADLRPKLMEEISRKMAEKK